MAPLPPNSTARYKIFYTVGGRQHTQEIRVDTVSPTVLEAAVDAYYTALSTAIYTTVIDEVQFAGVGSNIFNTVATGLEGNVYGSGTPAVVGEVPYYLNFIGRSAGGRRVRFAQFGTKALGSDYRYPVGESAVIDAARNSIAGNTSVWIAIDGTDPVWKSYVNAGVNAYWQRKVRP